MQLWELLLLALALAMDAFAVSVSDGICMKGLNKLKTLSIPLFFGVFQGLMPLIGYFAGSTFSDVIKNWDHWIAFALLSVIGGKMIIEAVRAMKQKDSCDGVGDSFSLRTVTLQAIATSIDALAIGISFAALGVNQYTSSLFIAVVTFICCLFGVILGKKFSSFLLKKAELIGGAILVLIGVKILIEHLLEG